VNLLQVATEDRAEVLRVVTHYYCIA
jgi:hypothetical protein